MKKNKELEALQLSKRTSFISLFTSGGTIFCCALPALLVSIGAGAALSSLVSVFPQIVWLSVYKTPIFIMAFIFIVLGGLFQWQARNLACPADPVLAMECQKTRKVSIIIYCVSVSIFLLGFIFAFILPQLAMR
ncbi:MAG: hypothetical protein HQ470_04165 [Methylophilales bacterium]|nr:hypothetical protein [Methylophilales bacterium]